jgi:O-antigen/teichoic acid export membrane protein
MSALKKLASDTALYGISSILGRVINYALVILHTHVFTKPRELSTQIELYAAVGVLNILYTYGMETTYFRYAAKYKDRAEKYYNLVQTAILCSSILMSMVLILLATPTSKMMRYEPGSQQLIIWLAIIIAIDAIVAIPFARLRLEKKAQKFVTVRMTNIIVNVGLNFFFLSFCKGIYDGKFLSVLKPSIDLIYSSNLGPGYIVLANLIANALFIPMLWQELRRYKFEFDSQEFKKLWVYAYPILIMGFAGTINVMADRLLLRHLLPNGFYPNHTTEDALGIYGSCYKLSIFMALATQAFRYAAEPFFFSKAEDRNAPALFAEIMKWF